MAPDYQKLGLTAGLEIHQQLDTNKLFCRCPSYLRKDEPHFKVKRKLHRVAGETGKIDAAVDFESTLNKEFVYEGYRDSTCLVELDEAPPHEINEAALDEVLKIALLLNCEIHPVTQIMRKTVINGSNTSGFQRTTRIAHSGYFETSFGRVGVEQICIEEDAARETEKNEKQTTFRLDRLGTPLIEITTSPDLHTPEQIKEAALKIGEIVRACKVKRGIGTIRQDLNISIKGHNRVEIKGFQEPDIMIKTVELEVQRQLKLTEIQKERKKRGKIEQSPAIDLSQIFKETKCDMIKKAIAKNQKVIGAKLIGWSGLLGVELQPNRRFGTEVSEFAKLFGVGGIMHSDETLAEKYKLSPAEIATVKKTLEVKEQDAFIMTIAEETIAQKAIMAAIKRASIQLEDSLPGEVRNSQPDGTTKFLRPMPGGARMYPETDLPLLKIKKEKIDELKKHLPKLRTEIKSELKQKGLHEELINLIVDDPEKLDEFKILSQVYSGDINLIAKMVALWRSEFATKYKKTEEEIKSILPESVLEKILEAIEAKKISESDAKSVLTKIAEGTNLEQALKIEKVDSDSLEHEIRRIIKEKPGLRPNAYMGLVMQKFKGKLDAKKAMEIINSLLNEK